MSGYVYDQAWQAEKQRLDALAYLYDEGTVVHLESLGVAAGSRCWEAGAGSGTIARWLVGRSGPDGYVLATDIDTRFLGDIAGLDVRVHDLTSGPPEPDSFDVVHSRAVVEHIPQHEDAFQSLVAALRPGGRLLVEDVFFPMPVADPNVPLLPKIWEAFVVGFRAAGADAYFGIKLPRLFDKYGLVETGAACRAPVVRFGTPSADFLNLSLEQLRERFVAANLLTDAEIDEALNMLRETDGAALPPLLVAAWGRRPD